jgi:peptide/nickel transport system ATP-binding protein
VTLLEVDSLTVSFAGVRVVDDVSFAIERGARTAIIGESGSGKTMSALAVIGLTPDDAHVEGSVRLDGVELLGRSDRDLARVRGEAISMVFQNPLTSLNPLMRVGRQIAEPLRRHHHMHQRAAETAARELCARVGLPDPDRAARAYPHQLSGGQRQRVGIAIALACRPALLIADEPTTALDVTVQAEVLALLADLVADESTSLLFITHDVALVPAVADDLLVMREGRIVEHGHVQRIIVAPEHPYTRELLLAARRTALPEDVASPGTGTWARS